MGRICVYDVAAETGGALTVLRDYHSRALADAENEYCFIVSIPELAEGPNVHVARFPEVKRSWAWRVAFDILRAHRIIEEFDPDYVLSLQNIVVPLTNRKQVVYIHNLLPSKLCDLRFSIKDDPVMWVRQNVIGYFIIRSAFEADEVIVQTGWMARRLADNCGVDIAKIRVESPVFEIGTFLAERSRVDSETVFFYPASAAPFKNHEVIVNACQCLAANGVVGYRVVLTVDGFESLRMATLRERIEEAGLPIEFHGWIASEEMGQWYADADCLLFPSKLETWGLPLKEAQRYELPIIVSDLEYARETVGEYEKASFFNAENPVALADQMRRCICQRR